MADPTRAQIETQWADAIDIINEVNDFGRYNSPNLLGLIDTLQTNYNGDYLDEAETAVEQVRANVASIISPGLASAIQRPFLRQYLQSVVGRTDLQNDFQMFQELYRYFILNNLRVESKVYTFGTPAAAAGNIGNNQIVRCTKDQYAFNIESGYTDAKRALCIADYETGTARGNELFQLVGGSTARDELERSGSGFQITLNALTTDQSLLFNASWTQWSSSTGSASDPDDIINWTSTPAVSSTVYELDSTNYFRPAPSDGATPYALKIKASALLSQALSVRGTKLRTDRPYLLALAWNAAIGSAVGTLTIRMGTNSTTVAVNGQAGWNITLCPGTQGFGSWYRAFAQDEMTIEIQWTRTSGDLLIDDVLFVEGTPFDSTFCWIIPSSVTTWIPNRVNDMYTWNDTALNAGVNQTWISRAFGVYLPHSYGSSVTFADAS